MRKVFLITAGAAAAVLLATAEARADAMATLVSGPTTGGSTFINVHPTVVGGAGLTKGAGLNFPSSSNSTFTVNGANAANQANAITAQDFVTWGLSFDQPWDLDDFSIRVDRNSSGPPNITVQLAINGSSTFTSVFTDNFGTAGEENLAISLAAFDNVTSVTFRAVFWGASSGAGETDFENSANIGGGTFILNASAIPEPATAGLLGLAGLAMLRRRR